MAGLLLFGTLMDDALRAIVAGADLPGKPAHLPGQAAWRAAGGDWPVLAAGQGATGLWLQPTADMLDRFDYYEAAFGYVRETAEAEVGGQPVTAWAYRPVRPDAASDAAWSLGEWQRDWAPLTRAAATEAMGLFGQLSPQQLSSAMPTMRMRAASRLRAAADPAPVLWRNGAEIGSIAVQHDTQPYTDFFAVRQTRLTHPRFNGQTSAPMVRAAWLSGDAVTVLPYDPLRDRVMLVEQFRYGAFARGDRYPWCLEPIAGRIDPGETAEDAVRRETREEAGLTLNRLIPVANYYPSPASVTEYLYSYIALADLPDTAAGLGGLETEQEDIRAHVMTFAELEDLIDSGEVDNAPLLVSALWLAPRRTSLG